MSSMKAKLDDLAERERRNVRQEEERIEQVRRDFDEKHPRIIPVEECVICGESFPAGDGHEYDRFAFPCCGQFTCLGCLGKVSDCPFCKSLNASLAGFKAEDGRLEFLTRLANMGNPTYQYLLGGHYRYGLDGIERNLEKAVYWFHQSANQGCREAHYYLFICYRDGEHVTKCLVTARMHLEQAAFHDYPRAQYQLAEFYLEGKGGLPRDEEKAKYWFTLVASRPNDIVESSLPAVEGCSSSRRNLADMYVVLAEAPGADLRSLGSSLDLAKYWFQRAIDCDFRGEASEAGYARLREVRGDSQDGLARVLFKRHMVDFPRILGGPEPYPTIVRLLEKSYENTNEPSSLVRAEQMKLLASSHCANCGVTSSVFPGRLMKCSRCKVAYYCSRDCQRQHFNPYHKAVCEEE